MKEPFTEKRGVREHVGPDFIDEGNRSGGRTLRGPLGSGVYVPSGLGSSTEGSSPLGPVGATTTGRTGDEGTRISTALPVHHPSRPGSCHTRPRRRVWSLTCPSIRRDPVPES